MRKDRRGHWAKTIAEQEESGLSVPVFCRHWRRRLRTVDRPVRFSQVETKPARDCATALQIVFAGGERLCMSRGVDAATLQLVLTAPLRPGKSVNVYRFSVD